MIAWLLAYWKPVSISAALLLYATLIWHMHSIYDEASARATLAREIEDNQRAQQQANDHATDLERSLAALRQKEHLTTQKLEAELAKYKITADCRVPDALVRLRNQAIATNRPAR